MKYRIIHLITSLQGGGSENFLRQILANSPPNFEHKVFYILKDGINGDRIRKLGISVQQTASIIGIYNQLKRECPDILHTLLYRAHQYGRCAGFLARIPAIISSQQAIDRWQQPWHRLLDSMTLRLCDSIAVNSSAAEQLIRNRLGNHCGIKIGIVPNGVDWKAFLPHKSSDLKEILHLPSNTILGGSLMRLHSEKGADLIPSYAEHLLVRYSGLHVVIGGVGPLENSLKTILNGRPFSDRIHFLGWVENTPQFLSQLDFFWMLSREESFPQSLLEAAGMGLPWVAPRVGGISDFAIRTHTGRLFQRENMVDATNETSQLLNHLNEEKKAAAEKMAFIRESFSEMMMIHKMYQFFTDTIQLHSPI